MNLIKVIFQKYQIIMSRVNMDIPNFSGIIEFCERSKVWYVNGLVHKEDGPALIELCGIKAWYINGKLHRLNGPAVEYPDGKKQWWIENKTYSEEQYWKIINK